jgi:hypothetical protein
MSTGSMGGDEALFWRMEAERSKEQAERLERHVAGCYTGEAAPVTVKAGDRIRIIPEAGPERVMAVMHVEHHIITLGALQ